MSVKTFVKALGFSTKLYENTMFLCKSLLRVLAFCENPVENLVKSFGFS